MAPWISSRTCGWSWDGFDGPEESSVNFDDIAQENGDLRWRSLLGTAFG